MNSQESINGYKFVLGFTFLKTAILRKHKLLYFTQEHLYQSTLDLVLYVP